MMCMQKLTVIVVLHQDLCSGVSDLDQFIGIIYLIQTRLKDFTVIQRVVYFVTFIGQDYLNPINIRLCNNYHFMPGICISLNAITLCNIIQDYFISHHLLPILKVRNSL